MPQRRRSRNRLCNYRNTASLDTKILRVFPTHSIFRRNKITAAAGAGLFISSINTKRALGDTAFAIPYQTPRTFIYATVTRAIQLLSKQTSLKTSKASAGFATPFLPRGTIAYIIRLIQLFSDNQALANSFINLKELS